MKKFIILLVICTLLAAFYNLLELYVGDNWISVSIFVFLLFLGRLILYFYRKRKNIHDNWFDI